MSFLAWPAAISTPGRTTIVAAPSCGQSIDAFLNGWPGEFEEADLDRNAGPMRPKSARQVEELGDAIGVAAAVAGNQDGVRHGFPGYAASGKVVVNQR